MGSSASVAVSNDDMVSRERGIELLGDEWDEAAWMALAVDEDQLIPGQLWNAKVAEYGANIGRASTNTPLKKGRRPGLSDRDLSSECWYFAVGQLVNPACLAAFDIHPKSSVPAELVGGRRFRLAFTAHDAVVAANPLHPSSDVGGRGGGGDGDDDSIGDHEVVTPYNHDDGAPLEWDYWETSGDNSGCGGGDTGGGGGDRVGSAGPREAGMGPLHGVLHKVSIDDLPLIDAVVEGLVVGNGGGEERRGGGGGGGEKGEEEEVDDRREGPTLASSALSETSGRVASASSGGGLPVRVKSRVRLYVDLGAGFVVSCWTHQLLEQGAVNRGDGCDAGAGRREEGQGGTAATSLSSSISSNSSNSSSNRLVSVRSSPGLLFTASRADGSASAPMMASSSSSTPAACAGKSCQEEKKGGLCLKIETPPSVGVAGGAAAAAAATAVVDRDSPGVLGKEAGDSSSSAGVGDAVVRADRAIGCVPEERLVQVVVQGLVGHGVEGQYVESVRRLEALPRTPVTHLLSFDRRVATWGAFAVFGGNSVGGGGKGNGSGGGGGTGGRGEGKVGEEEEEMTVVAVDEEGGTKEGGDSASNSGSIDAGGRTGFGPASASAPHDLLARSQSLPVWGASEVRLAHRAAAAKGGFVTCCNGKVLVYDPRVIAAMATATATANTSSSATTTSAVSALSTTPVESTEIRRERATRRKEAEAARLTGGGSHRGDNHSDDSFLPLPPPRFLPLPLVAQLSALLGARDMETSACRERYDPLYGVEDDVRNMTQEHRCALEDLLVRSPIGPCLAVVAWRQEGEEPEEPEEDEEEFWGGGRGHRKQKGPQKKWVGREDQDGGDENGQVEKAPYLSVPREASFRVVIDEVD